MGEVKKGKIPLVLAVDTGGTFTDVLLLDAGNLRSLKISSTPSDPADAVLELRPGQGALAVDERDPVRTLRGLFADEAQPGGGRGRCGHGDLLRSGRRGLRRSCAVVCERA